MLTPHSGESAEFIEVGSTTQLFTNQIKFFGCEAELLRRGNGHFHAG
jgi:hypothetical protein